MGVPNPRSRDTGSGGAFARRAESAREQNVAAGVRRESIATVTVRLSAVARQILASFGETRRSLGEGGKPDTADDRRSRSEDL
jgi:hypothetical protein